MKMLYIKDSNFKGNVLLKSENKIPKRIFEFLKKFTMDNIFIKKMEGEDY
jgi:hypothetical protein